MSVGTSTGIRRVAIIGAGRIGTSWAAAFLAQGLDVAIWDPDPAAERRVADGIGAAWPLLTALGLAPMADPARWRWAGDLIAAVDGVDFVQESAPDRYEIKLDLLKRIDRALPREVVLASSSSGLLISRLQEGCNYPERCVIGHPGNPPHLIPLVEVVGGFKTSHRSLETAMAFYREIGKRPIAIRKEVPGHLANRLTAALWREAVHLVNDGVASVADVDAAITEGPGLAWALSGPHLAGALAAGGMAPFLRDLAPGLAALWPGLGQPALSPDLGRRLGDGVAAEIGSSDLDEVTQRRERALASLLALRRRLEAGDL